jgi:DNA-binding SARP family transcriptional activator
MDRLELSLLGGFRARLESRTSVAIPTKKGQALLAYLACSPAESHPRDSLAAMFWGDLPHCHTRHSLRQTLLMLRMALASRAPSVLCGDSTCVSLDRAGITVDVVEFRRLAKMGTVRALERAAELYQGDFLAGVSDGTPAFEEWLRGEREQLQALAVRSFSKLADLQRASGLTEKAIGTAERALKVEPTEESVHRTLMRLYLAVGRTPAALRQYRQCVAILQREFGVEPEAITRELAREILSARDSSGRSSRTSKTFSSTVGERGSRRLPAGQH